MAWGDPYFAWVAEDEAFDPVAHRRFDEEVEVWNLDVTDSGHALLELLVKPPEGGLLRPGRKRWGVLSYERGDGSLVLLARGCIDGFPLGGHPEESTLRFKCAPGDWQDVQAAALEDSKGPPHWSDVLVAPEDRDDPVEILDGQSSLVAFHPATHACALHDVFGTGLPVWDVGLNWYDDDQGTISAEVTDAPVVAVEVEVTAAWTEKRSGILYASSALASAFGGAISTLSGDAFVNRWPRAGDGIGNDNGYVVRTSELTRVYPEGEPAEAGPFQASSDVYNYVLDAQLTAPVARDVLLERAYFDGELVIAWSAEQARRERVLIRMRSGAQDGGMGSGVIRRISVECVDVTADELTPPWQPDTYYAEGALVRHGGWNWARTVAGVSAATWAADFTDFDMESFPPVLIQNWERQADDQSPIGGPDRDAYLPTVRGAPALLAAAMKGRAALAEGMLVGELTITVPLDDAVEAGLWIGMRVRVQVPEGRLAIEGDSITGKVSAYRMSSSAAEDVCEITMRFALGSGKETAAPSGSNHGSLTGEPWDVIALPDLTGSSVRPMATGGIQRVRVVNAVEDQVAYVEARDYSPDDGRTDPKATDPAALLGDVPTHFVIDLVPLAADGEILWEAEVDVLVPFEGPMQADLGGAS